MKNENQAQQTGLASVYFSSPEAHQILYKSACYLCYKVDAFQIQSFPFKY